MGAGHFITDEGLKQIAKFKYTAGEYSTLDNILNPWWLFAASCFPAWVSPNAITFSGFLGVVLSVVIGLVWRLEPAAYLQGHSIQLLVLFLMWAYQTLDAVDGKHARNTGQSTPLGALFDHGCDAVVQALGALNTEFATSHPSYEAQDSASFVILMGSVLPAAVFFFAQFEAYHTGVLSAAGITEAQMALQMVCLLSAQGGPALFHIDASLWFPEGLRRLSGNVSLKESICAMASCYALVTIGGNVRRVVGRGNSSLLHVVSSAVPCMVQIGCCLMLVLCTPAVFQVWRLLCVGAMQLSFSDLNLRFVIAGTSRMHFPSVHLVLAPFTAVCMLVCIVPSIGLDASVQLMCAVVVWHIISILRLARDTISLICKTLDVPFLAAVPAPKRT